MLVAALLIGTGTVLFFMPSSNVNTLIEIMLSSPRNTGVSVSTHAVDAHADAHAHEDAHADAAVTVTKG